jgi:uncharacterized protein (UPF0333 family)
MGVCGRKGQAALEYVLALAALLVATGVMGYLVSAARQSAHRTQSLVGSDYP